MLQMQPGIFYNDDLHLISFRSQHQNISPKVWFLSSSVS